MVCRLMQSTAELCFADPDFLPSYCRKPERQESYRSNPDTDEAQRFFGSDDDLVYLHTAATRQDVHPDDLEDLGLTSEDDLDCEWVDDDEPSAEELIAEYYRDHPGDTEPLRPVLRQRQQIVTRHHFVPMKVTDKMVEARVTELRKALEEAKPEECEVTDQELALRIQARCELSRELENRTVRVAKKTVKQVLVGNKPRREPVDAEEAAIRRRSRSEVREVIDRSYRHYEHARGGNSKPPRADECRETLRCVELADRDSLDERRMSRLFSEIKLDRKSTKKARHLVAA